jgi:hypothetical protein
MNYKDKFLEIYKENIKREGSEEFLNFLLSRHSDFFDAPASTKYHGSYAGGLVEHSVHVYEALKDYLSREQTKNLYKMDYSNETIALVALLHDVCKINVYHTEMRNKKIDGVWQQVPVYTFEDSMPFGHGEKSVYMIQPYMRISREEAFAIRYHMGFSGTEDARNVGYSFEHFPLAFALSTADMEATYFMDGKIKLQQTPDEKAE